MTDTPIRLTTRSRATAEAIRDAVPFFTSGNMRGTRHTPDARAPYLDAPSKWVSHHLNQVEWSIYDDDRMMPGIDYIVWSYDTPIAWRRADGRWRVVAQSFSITTTKHQGNLYLIEREEHRTEVTPIDNARNRNGRPNWRVECNTCGTVLRLFVYKPEAQRFAHGHRFNHDHPIYSI